MSNTDYDSDYCQKSWRRHGRDYDGGYITVRSNAPVHKSDGKNRYSTNRQDNFESFRSGSYSEYGPYYAGKDCIHYSLSRTPDIDQTKTDDNKSQGAP